MRNASALTACTLVSFAAIGCGHSGTHTFTSRAAAPRPRHHGHVARRRTPTAITHSRAAPTPPFAVQRRDVTYVDRSRMVTYPGQPPQPRRLLTQIRLPAGHAEPAGLVVFGHGFAETPDPYAPLLRAWARAGYVVAAPVFPLEDANAPGGPDKRDLINQPRDISFVIDRLLAADGNPRSLLYRRIDPREIAVAGQSDGGETALAVAYDRHFRDPRIRAAMILSGAQIPGTEALVFPARSPPLLATQGTADTVNPPSFTRAFFDLAPPPKFLLTLFGASHLGPYTNQQPQLGVVARVTTAFLDRYLEGKSAALHRMIRAGDVAGVSVLTSDP